LNVQEVVKPASNTLLQPESYLNWTDCLRAGGDQAGQYRVAASARCYHPTIVTDHLTGFMECAGGV
jgi:hypothetical protein